MLLLGTQLLLLFLKLHVFNMFRFLFRFNIKPELAVLSAGTTATFTQHTLIFMVFYAQHLLPFDTVSLSCLFSWKKRRFKDSRKIVLTT